MSCYSCNYIAALLQAKASAVGHIRLAWYIFGSEIGSKMAFCDISMCDFSLRPQKTTYAKSGPTEI